MPGLPLLTLVIWESRTFEGPQPKAAVVGNEFGGQGRGSGVRHIHSTFLMNVCSLLMASVLMASVRIWTYFSTERCHYEWSYFLRG